MRTRQGEWLSGEAQCVTGPRIRVRVLVKTESFARVFIETRGLAARRLLTSTGWRKQQHVHSALSGQSGGMPVSSGSFVFLPYYLT